MTAATVSGPSRRSSASRSARVGRSPHRESVASGRRRAARGRRACAGGIARERQHAQRGAVIAAGAVDDAPAAGEQARHLDRVLVGLGARQTEEDLAVGQPRRARPPAAARRRASLSGKTDDGRDEQAPVGRLHQRAPHAPGARGPGWRSRPCCPGPTSRAPSAVSNARPAAADDLQRGGVALGGPGVEDPFPLARRQRRGRARPGSWRRPGRPRRRCGPRSRPASR